MSPALVVLLFGVLHSINTTSSLAGRAFSVPGRLGDRQEECLRQSVRRQVPRGAKVFVIAQGYNLQLLDQYLASWAKPVTSLGNSEIKVALTVGQDATCYGEQLVVTRK